MFGSLLGEKTDYKVSSLAKRALSDFRFFSKVSDGDSESIFDVAKSIEETNNWNIKSIKTQKIRTILENASIAELIKHMKCNNEIIRSIAAQFFAECDSPNLLNCIELMLNDENENLKLSCLDALLHLNTLETLFLFEKGLKDISPSVRLKAAIGISEIARTFKHGRAIAILNDSINDPDTDVREFIIDELGLIGNEQSLTQLFKAMDNFKGDEKELISESLSIILSKALV